MSLEGLALPAAAPVPDASTEGSHDFSLEALADSWKINGVQYRNGIYQVELSKQLLPSGTQDEHAARSREAITRGEYQVGDFPLYFSTKRALFLNKDAPGFKDEIEQIRAFLQKQIREHRLVTLTRIRNTHSGQEKVIHNYKLDDQYELEEDLVGPDEWVKDSQNSLPYKALLGADNLQEIDAVYNWLNGTPARIYRLNSKPEQDIESIAWVDAYSDRVLLSCYRNPQISVPAVGVRARKIMV